MNTQIFENEEEWLEYRKGKITGTKVKDIIVKRGNGKKVGYYQLIADRLKSVEDNEDPRDRGKRLEPESIELFETETGKKVDTRLMIWTREDNENIAISPDGFIKKESAGVESKSLGSAKHIEAYLTQKVPSENEDQIIQYLVVNDSLARVYCLFHDPSLIAIQFFYLVVERKDVADKVAEYLEYQRTTLKEIDEIVANLTNF